MRHNLQTSDSLLYKVNVTDMDCMDSCFLSFKLNNKCNLKNQYLGLLREYLVFEYRNKIIDTVNIFNPGSSSRIMFNNKLIIITTHPGFINNSKGEIIPLSNRKTIYERYQLKFKSVFGYLRINQKLGRIQWNAIGNIKCDENIKDMLKKYHLMYEAELDPSINLYGLNSILNAY